MTTHVKVTTAAHDAIVIHDEMVEGKRVVRSHHVAANSSYEFHLHSTHTVEIHETSVVSDAHQHKLPNLESD